MTTKNEKPKAVIKIGRLIQSISEIVRTGGLSYAIKKSDNPK